jgi:RNA polymerase sigma-70 factor, ECF subfamily
MSSVSVSQITELLIRWSEGREGALDQLTQLVYAELRRMAAALMRNERPGHTLEPTAVVHELYLQLADARTIHWKCRGQFFAIAAKLMRRILVDHARKRKAAKRSSADFTWVNPAVFPMRGFDIIELDGALSRFAEQHPRQAAVVELRFFGGLTVEQTAEALSCSGDAVSLSTVERDWRFSRAWLQEALGAK